MWTSREGVGKVWERSLYSSLIPRPCELCLRRLQRPAPLWAVHLCGADLHTLSSAYRETWELSLLPLNWMPAVHLPGIHQEWSKICAGRIRCDCHFRGSFLIERTPWLWPIKASTKKEWNMLGREARVLIGSGVRYINSFLSPSVLGGALAQGMWDTRGEGVYGE